MLLCDIGNTSYHFLSAETDYKKDVKEFDPSTIKERIFYICVNPTLKIVLDSLENWIDLAKFIDMDNYYDTMGVDRIFACEALSDGIIIDAGSAITVDIVDAGLFQGGFIYPGTKAMKKSYTDISTALDYKFNYTLDIKKLPKNSADAISYGYLKLLHSEVISHNKDIYLTGGDAQKLHSLFPNAKIEKRLIFNGMKRVIKKIELI